MDDLERGSTSAEDAYRQLVELDPDDEFSLVEIAQLRQNSGDWAAAQEYFWRAIEAQPSSWRAYMGLSTTLCKLPGQSALSNGLGL